MHVQQRRTLESKFGRLAVDARGLSSAEFVRNSDGLQARGVSSAFVLLQLWPACCPHPHHAGTGGSIVRRALVQNDVGQESDGKAHFVASGWSVPG